MSTYDAVDVASTYINPPFPPIALFMLIVQEVNVKSTLLVALIILNAPPWPPDKETLLA
jgi:hypothetical protein